jgi:hypothetical protein
MRFVVADNREVVKLSAPSAGGLTIHGKFKPRRRVLDLTDAQAALFKTGLLAAVAAKVLYAPAGWPAADAPAPAAVPPDVEVDEPEVDEPEVEE